MRSVKPDFFTDEDVGELSLPARLLFIGLWTEADCRGRLADKPKTLKAKLFPYDNLDVDALLAELAENKFILRYEVQGIRAIWIIKFEKHQKPHPKEADLGFPDPPAESREISGKGSDEAQVIPSSPRFSGGGSYGGSGNGSTADAGVLELELQEPEQPSRRTQLNGKLTETFRARTGQTYAFDGAKDARAVAKLMTLEKDDDEIIRRWLIAISTGPYPGTKSIATFASRFNEFAARGARENDPRRGTVGAEEIDWSKQKTGTGEWSDG